MNAIKTCSPAVYQHTTQIILFLDMISETVSLTDTLKGLNSSKKCEYERYVNDVINLEYTPEMKDLMLAKLTPEYIAKTRSEPDFPKEFNNLTDEELRKKALIPSVELVASVKNEIGTIIKCSSATIYLLELYTKWQNGEFSFDSMSTANCSAYDSSGKVF